jgi:ubiquinone/menaquinone biosynthesis C-methylase UbiE
MAERVCPVKHGRLLASSLRKLFHNPRKIIGPYIKEKMTVLDVGCAMGFFSLPAAKMVGHKGKVICVDLQQGMLDGLEKRAVKAGVSDIIKARLCRKKSLAIDDLENEVDFAFTFYVVHEVPDTSAFFSELFNVLKHDAKLLVSEPKGHVTAGQFEKMIKTAKESGFAVAGRPKISFSRTVLLKKTFLKASRKNN